MIDIPGLIVGLMNKRPPKHINNCKISDTDPLSKSAIPREVEVILPDGDGSKVYVMWHGEQSIAVDDYVRIRRDNSDTNMYVIEGYGGGSGGSGGGGSGSWPDDQKANIGTTEYATITAADTAASGTDTIKVGSGTFDEQVDLTNAGYLIGTGRGTIISNATSPSMTVSNSNAVIRDLTVDNSTASVSTALDVNIAAEIYDAYLYSHGTGTNRAIDCSNSLLAWSCKLVASGGSTNQAIRQFSTGTSYLYNCEITGDVSVTGATLYLIGCNVTGDVSTSGGTLHLIGSRITGSVTESSGTLKGWYYDSDGDYISFAATIDLDGLADGLVLDADGDTTISAPTDDQIDFEVGGTDRVTITDSGITVVNRVVESDWPLDPELTDTYSSSVPDHFRQNTGSTPTGWTESDAAVTSTTAQFFSFWQLNGSSTDTSWDYRRQTGIDLEVDAAGDTPALIVGPLIVADGQYTADVDYYFGFYKDNSGIDLNTFVRIHLQWDSTGSQWRVRGQTKDSSSGTQHDGSWFVIKDSNALLPLPLYLIPRIVESTHAAQVYVGSIWNPRSNQNLRIFSQAPTTAVDYDDMWVRFHQSRGAGVQDIILIGAVDIE